MPCLLKVALNKQEDEETQKEVEMALLSLSCLRKGNEIKKKKYLEKIAEIIKCHQEHRNLTQLAYQSAWSILMRRYLEDNDLTGVIVNELHFVKEAARELEELVEHLDWKEKEDTWEKAGFKTNEFLNVDRWIMQSSKGESQ
eukprot:MONOS_3559.1-p1 / transcript=MONOS_3559.1 / gene=MONOS_3559 / organism=Monocercomonoides_exilis_PA203 / gene_product=unspecified product / transcript_product=unspecified product / location=Mono_scaffold00084:111823-112387(+) / protein_length=142 / sequence_SO=supercontig / SO=protein_coding / is_pseudo=false